MPAGIEIYNADGSLQISITTRLTRFLGTYFISRDTQSGSITHPGFATGKPFCVPLDWTPNRPTQVPQIYPRSDRIDWVYEYDNVDWISVNVAIGVF